MKKLLLILPLLLPIICMAQGNSKIYDLVMGTRTRGTSDGIYVYRFNSETGEVSYLNHVDGIIDPTYLCISANKGFVYAVSDQATGNGGVYAYKFDAVTGRLDSVNNQPAFGGPLYLSVDRDQKNLFAAHYLGGNLSVYPINADGSLSPASQLIHDEGSSINKERQEGPHVHTAMLSPDEKYLIATDLGTDKLFIYKFDPSQKQVLTLFNTVNVTPGNGPRHVEFSADGKYLYLLQEMAGLITAYQFNGGKPTALQTITMLPDNFKGTIQAADIHLSPDGRFLYASNRGTEDKIIQYAVDKSTGKLTFIDGYSSMGKSPRNFVIDPTGNFLFISNQYSDSVTVYKIDKSTGKLTLTQTAIKIDGPMCIRFVPVDESK
ncbi:lactonase family protein [Mucilaginibacter corticis]|uniref:Lactonase family protein n=1 Tax=Mucilaginibacter corticis TaxID=2597670 RepID=A0A556MTW0_9SPHI|nr:lactonase family protein [Mucilaginibacter corticis]TSJ43384.1 lactonase family protein [Mucilaginibacter corticis]